MTPAHVVQITTPKKFILNGLWFGPKKSRTVFIFVHGLTGSLFSMRSMAQTLTGPSASVLTFNTRGFGIVNNIKNVAGKHTNYLCAGTAHEVFKDSVDDIDGAIRLAKKHGAKRIYLVGHSTGCQKIVYWASKKNARDVEGLLLFGPLSDYSGAVATKGRSLVEKGAAHAKKLVAAGKPHELMPSKFSEWFECDAQRYLSLYSPDSAEEIFTYARPEIRPATLVRVKTPILVFLADADEYGDLPPQIIANWFDVNIRQRHRVVVVPKVDHGFKGAERAVSREVAKFMKEA